MRFALTFIRFLILVGIAGRQCEIISRKFCDPENVCGSAVRGATRPGTLTNVFVRYSFNQDIRAIERLTTPELLAADGTPDRLKAAAEKIRAGMTGNLAIRIEMNSEADYFGWMVITGRSGDDGVLDLRVPFRRIQQRWYIAL